MNFKPHLIFCMLNKLVFRLEISIMISVNINYIFGNKKLINFVAEIDGEVCGEEDFAEVNVEHQV